MSVSMETAGPQERGSPWAAGPGEAPRPCGPAPADQGNGLRGDIPKYSFGVSCPLWNPHLPLQLPPKKPSSTWWGTPSSRDSWGSAGPHIQDPREAGPGQRVPTPSPGSWPVQGSSVKRAQGKVGGGRPSPHCCHHRPQGHLSRHWSHPWEAGARRARCQPSQVSAAHGLGFRSPLPSAGAAGEQGPTSTQSWQHPERPGARAFPAARRGQA